MRKMLDASRHGTLMILVFLALFPLYYLIVNSTKSSAAFAADQWLPTGQPEWSNYSRAWDVVGNPIINSVIVVTVTVTGVLVIAGLAAYAFAIVKFPGWKLFYAATFILLLVPSFLLLIPLYLQITRLPEEVSGTYLAIILPSVAAAQAFSIFVLKTAFEQMPQELIDSARIDGASEVRILRSIVAPLTKPVFASVAVIQCVALWNDFLLPQLVLDRRFETVSVALVAFSGDPGRDSSPDYGPLMAGYVLSAIPLVILFSVAMRSYIAGLTSGAVKL